MAVVAMQAPQANRRPDLNVPRQVLDAFDPLVAMEEKKRTDAGMVILQHVDHQLREHEQGKEMPVGVKYIVQRLVSGLASTRLRAREGYFSTLCFLLRLHPAAFTPAFVLALLTKQKSAAMKAVNKDEARDLLVAELLLCGAVVRSGVAGQDPAVLQWVVNKLCAMRDKKSYMDITATQFLVNLMESCEGNSMHEAVWGSLQVELQSPIAELSPSQLWLRLVLLRKHRASPPVWLTSTLTPKNHQALGQTLLKTAPDFPKVHPVVEELVTSLLSASSSSSSSSSLLGKFWQVTVEPLQGQTSPARMQITFHLLRVMVPHLKMAREVKEVVTPSIVALLLSAIRQPVKDLKEAAKGVTTALVQLVQDRQDEASKVQQAVVRALLTQPGSVRFDQLAGHRVLAVMVPHFTLKTLKSVAKTLLEVVNKGGRDYQGVVDDRNYAAHILGNLLAQPRACTPEAATWKKEQLTGLLKAVLAAGQQEGDTTKDAFFKALGKQVGHIKEYKGILLDLMKDVDQEVDREAGGSPAPLSDEGKEQWRRVQAMLAVLRGKQCEEGTEEDTAKTVFQVLYCQMALHLFVDVTVATESISEFMACHKEVMKLGTLKLECLQGEDDDDSEEEEEDQPTWVEVVTELLLSLMTQEMHLFRSVVQGLFWLLTPLMTATALSLLTDVLDTDKARELVKKEDGDDKKGSGDDKEGSGDDKEGSGDDKEGSGDEKEGSGDDSDDDDGDEEEDDGDDSNLFTLRKKMIDAAGGIDIDVDVDMDTVPQEELDRLDEALGALMAEYQGKQPKRKNKKRRKGGGNDCPQLTPDEQSLMHFQTRVCDMLIVYIKAAPNMALQVGLVNPIFKALRKADLDVRQKDLQNKLENVITALKKKKKFNVTGEITPDSWKETVSEFFSLACQLPERFSSVVQSCYSLLMHCGRQLLGLQEEAVGRANNFLVTTYVAHLEDFLTNSCQLHNVVPFCEPCTYNIGGLWRVAATMVRFAFDPEVKMLKKTQALKILQQLYGNKELGAHSNPEAVALDLQNLYGKVLKTVDSLQPPIHAVFVSNLFGLLHTILQADRRSEGPPSLAWVEVQGGVERFRQRISKTIFKSIRKEYNVFTSLLNKDKPKKQRGEKRGAAQVNQDGEQQENLMKKSKMEKRNSLTDNTSPGGKGKVGKVVKKKKKNKGTPVPDQPSEKEDTTGPAKTMIDGEDKTIINLAPKRQEKKMIKKKKNKLIKRKLEQLEEERTAQGEQEQNASLVSDSPLTTEAKKKKKKRKSIVQENGTM